MQLSTIAFSCLFIVAAGEGDSAGDQRHSQVSLSDVEATPEMWFYSQERERYEDPMAAVRRKAEFRAQQRQARIASMKAFGMSKQRPLVYYTPFHTYFSVWNNHGFLTTIPPYVIHSPTVAYPVR